MPRLGWRAPVEDRLWKFISPEPNSGCWLWTGVVDNRPTHMPYGRFWYETTNIPAHQASWRIYRGPVPDGMILCHRCDVPSCVNPDHLFLGTHKDNTQDMMSKARDSLCRLSRRGERSNFSKLTAEQVLNIRGDQRYQRVIAADYGISQSGVSMIKCGKNWRHV